MLCNIVRIFRKFATALNGNPLIEMSISFIFIICLLHPIPLKHADIRRSNQQPYATDTFHPFQKRELTCNHFQDAILSWYPHCRYAIIACEAARTGTQEYSCVHGRSAYIRRGSV